MPKMTILQKAFLYFLLFFLFFSYLHPVQAFDSNTVSGLVSWVKADSELLNNGNAVIVIHDRSNIAHDYTGSGATYITNYLNGKPAFSFNSTGGFLNSGFSVNGINIFIVGDNAGSTGNSGIFSCQASANSSNDYQNGGLLGWTTGIFGTGMIDVSYNGTCNIDGDCKLTNIFHTVNVTGIMQYQVDNSNKYASISWNNTLVTETIYIRPIVPLSFSQCALGARLSPSLMQPFTGHILEMLTFDHRLSPSDRNIIFSYLEEKYAIGSTPTPSPTPTPTPTPTTKVVVIPGLGASWNIASLLSCGFLDIGEWGLNPLAEDIYNPLLSTLASAGYTPLPYYYDWRKVVVSNNSKLTTFIEGQTGDNERVHLIGHSMGGLVGRSYLETATENAKLEKLLTVGSPHQGAVLAYPAWSAGEAWIDNFLWRFATTFVLKHCGGLAGNDRETMRSLIPSVQNLLPTTDYLRDHTTGNLKPISFMNAQNNWLPTGTFPPFWGVTVGTLSGTNEKTLSVLEVKDPTKHDKKLGDWLDGKPMQKEMSLDGDDTVLLSSSQVPGASTNVAIPSSHNTLVNSAQGLTEIFNFLGTAPSSLSAVAYEEPTSALILMSYPAVFWVTDPDGTIRQDKSGMVAFTNPKKGTYKFFLQPKKFSTDIIVAQFLANGKTLWKEYKHNSILPKFGSMNFDPANPLEDILK